MITDNKSTDSEHTVHDVTDSKAIGAQCEDLLVTSNVDRKTIDTMSREFSIINAPGKTENAIQTYKMNYPRRGKCVILNQENFSDEINYPQRTGTDKDCQSLERTFSNLGFDLEIHKDLKRDQIMTVLKKASEEDHSDAACFVCCVLSHGEPGVILAHDEGYAENELWDKFVGEKCPSLNGKPKLFFIQACRGDKTDRGVDAPDGLAVPSKPDTICIPSHADFLIARPTVIGYYAWRSLKDGSWFIQALCECLISYISEDFHTILTAVAFKVSRDYVSISDRPDFDKRKQMPNFMSTLTKKLYLAIKLQ